jgi:hypothetical protein
MKNYIKDNAILWRYVEQASNTIESAVNRGSEINLRCNICGDGENRHKKRGYLKWDRERDIIYYKCFNYGDCDAAGEGNAWGGAKWLKHTSPGHYKQYRTELFQPTKKVDLSKKVANIMTAKKKLEQQKLLDEKEKQKEEAEAVKHFVPILKGTDRIFKKARDICISRRIPKEVWTTFFVSIDGKYKNRLIIPFYDSEGLVYYYQARDLIGWTPKYLNRKLNRDSAIYGIYNVDKNAQVMVLEGPIDSMFIDNSIATLGITLTDIVKKSIKDLDLYWIYDNDLAGNIAARAKLKQGGYVFNWKKFLNKNCLHGVKDFNDVYIAMDRYENYTFPELYKYFTKEYLDLVYFV